MKIDVADYNTEVEFPDTMTPEQIKPILQKRFPPIASTLTMQTSTDAFGQEAEKLSNPWKRENVKAISKEPIPTEPTVEQQQRIIQAMQETNLQGVISAGLSMPKTFGQKLGNIWNTFARSDKDEQAAKDIVETAASMARGLVAFPVSKIVGGYLNLTYGGEMAKRAEMAINEKITGRPSSENAQEMFETFGQVLNVPFYPAQKVGEAISEISPTIGYGVGSALEIATPMIAHAGIKRATAFTRIYKDAVRGELSPSSKAMLETMPEESRTALIDLVDTVKTQDPRTVLVELKRAGLNDELSKKFIEDISDIDAKPIEPMVTPRVQDTLNIESSVLSDTMSSIAKGVLDKMQEERPTERGSINATPKDNRRYSFGDPTLEKEYLNSHGLPKPPLLESVKDFFSSAWEGITRTYKDLPKEERFLPAEVILKQFEKSHSKVSYDTLTAMRGETYNFKPYQMDIFERKALLDDLKYTLEEGKKIPFGFTKDSLINELSKLDAEIIKDPAIQKAVEIRKSFQGAMVEEYVNLRKYFGDDVSARFKNENYYRHQVIEYAKGRGPSGTGEGVSVPTSRGFLKERKGSKEAINTNYLEAEYEYRAQMLYDIETMKTLKRLEGYNIIETLRTEAKAKGIEDWHELLPDGYVEWQPRKGNVFYTTDSIPVKMAEQLRDGILEQIGITADDLRSTLAIGGKRREIVIPEELAKTLDHLNERSPDNFFSRYFVKEPMRAWKVWTLVSPTRVIKYNIRNMTGDADAVFIGNPRGFLKTKEAMGDLWNVIVKGEPMKGELKEWFDRGGMDSTLQAQELGDVNTLSVFKNIVDEHKGLHYIPKEVWDRYWKAARMTTDFREGILRYANYLDYLEQINKNGGNPKNYGASDRKKIDQLPDPRDKAYELSNDLLGAYDRISVAGQYLREHAIPFWSWKEVNFKRTIQLWKNAWEDGHAATTAGYKALGSLAKTPYTAYRAGSFVLKATAMWSVFQVWNNTMFPQEEAELSKEDSARPHIIFGRDQNGKILYFNRIGAIGDFLQWFGLDASPKLVDNLFSGKQTLLEIAKDMAKSPVNVIAQGISPIVKTPVELLLRQRLFPDIFNPGLIRNRGQYVAESLGLGNEYKAVMGIPYEGYLSTIPGLFIYRADPGQTSYSYIYEEKQRFLEKIGKTFDGWMLTPKGNALYNIKLAIRYNDEDALLKALVEYQTLGGTAKGMKESLKAMHPLHGMNKKIERAFIDSLDNEGIEKLQKAIRFYETTLHGKPQAPVRVKTEE